MEINNELIINLKGEEFEDLIYSEDELNLSIQILQSVGIVNGNLICK